MGKYKEFEELKRETEKLSALKEASIEIIEKESLIDTISGWFR